MFLCRHNLSRLADDAELIVSEIATNAIKATANVVPPQRNSEVYDQAGLIRVCLRMLPTELRIEVWDSGIVAPRRREAQPDEEGGRGLFLVDLLTTTWGTIWPPTGGKIVYASIALD
jgi:anti-sigma regulatory factor (Ser/Thr protein kinase)